MVEGDIMGGEVIFLAIPILLCSTAIVFITGSMSSDITAKARKISLSLAVLLILCNMGFLICFM